MAVFGSAVKVDGKPLNDLIGTDAFTAEEWETMKVDVTKGGAKIIELRGRSSFQSPSYLSVEMIRAAMGGEKFRWPAGTYVKTDKYDHIMMAMNTTLDANGCHYTMPEGTARRNCQIGCQLRTPLQDARRTRDIEYCSCYFRMEQNQSESVIG